MWVVMRRAARSTFWRTSRLFGLERMVREGSRGWRVRAGQGGGRERRGEEGERGRERREREREQERMERESRRGWREREQERMDGDMVRYKDIFSEKLILNLQSDSDSYL